MLVWAYVCGMIQHTLGDCEDMYFVESEAKTVMERYQRELAYITRAIRARNTATSILYENLIPSWIPNSQYFFLLFPYCFQVSAVGIAILFRRVRCQ